MFSCRRLRPIHMIFLVWALFLNHTCTILHFFFHLCQSLLHHPSPPSTLHKPAFSESSFTSTTLPTTTPPPTAPHSPKTVAVLPFLHQCMQGLGSVFLARVSHRTRISRIVLQITGSMGHLFDNTSIPDLSSTQQLSSKEVTKNQVYITRKKADSQM